MPANTKRVLPAIPNGTTGQGLVDAVNDRLRRIGVTEAPASSAVTAASSGMGGAAAGPAKAVQYNAGTSGAPVFGGDAGLVYDPAPGTQLLTLNGSYSLAKLTTAPALAPTNFAKWYFDGTQLLVSYSGAAYVPLVGAGGSQTPWLSHINAAGYTLSNVGAVYVASGADLTGVIPLGFAWQTSSKNRWIWEKVNAETGTGNQGSDLALYCYDDPGTTLLSTALSIKRSSGLVSVNSIAANGDISGGGNLNLTGSLSVYQLNGTLLIDHTGAFVGGGVNVSGGVGGAGFNPKIGGTQYFGAGTGGTTFSVVCSDSVSRNVRGGVICTS